MKEFYVSILNAIKKNKVWTLVALGVSFAIGFLSNNAMIYFKSGTGKLIYFGLIIVIYFVSKFIKRKDKLYPLVIASEMLTLLGLAIAFDQSEYTGNDVTFKFIMSLIIFILLIAVVHAFEDKPVSSECISEEESGSNTQDEKQEQAHSVDDDTIHKK